MAVEALPRWLEGVAAGAGVVRSGEKPAPKGKGIVMCLGKLIWCVTWRFSRNLKASDLQQEPNKEVSGFWEPPLTDQNGYNGYLPFMKL